jgi:cold shock CspA family protein
LEKPVQITARQLELPDNVKEMILDRASKLERVFPRLVGCSVVVEGPGRHHQRGGPYTIQIDLRVPGADPIIVNRKTGEDLPSTIREGFDAATRQLEDFARIRRREVKTHEEPPRARVSRLFADEGYGFLKTLDAREVYFHRNSVLNGAFDRLEIGTEVRYHEEQGEQGPQASTVEVVTG